MYNFAIVKVLLAAICVAAVVGRENKSIRIIFGHEEEGARDLKLHIHKFKYRSENHVVSSDVSYLFENVADSSDIITQIYVYFPDVEIENDVVNGLLQNNVLDNSLEIEVYGDDVKGLLSNNISPNANGIEVELDGNAVRRLISKDVLPNAKVIDGGIGCNNVTLRISAANVNEYQVLILGI